MWQLTKKSTKNGSARSEMEKNETMDIFEQRKTEWTPANFIGTCTSEAVIADLLDIPDDEVLEYMLDDNVERCERCEWWFHSGELTDDDFGKNGFCYECKRENLNELYNEY